MRSCEARSRRYVSFIEADTALYRFMVLQAPKSGLEVSTLIDRIARRVAQALANNLPDLPGGKLTTQIWAYGIVGTVHQAGDWWVASAAGRPRAAGRRPDPPACGAACRATSTTGPEGTA